MSREHIILNPWRIVFAILGGYAFVLACLAVVVFSVWGAERQTHKNQHLIQDGLRQQDAAERIASENQQLSLTNERLLISLLRHQRDEATKVLDNQKYLRYRVRVMDYHHFQILAAIKRLQRHVDRR